MIRRQTDDFDGVLRAKAREFVESGKFPPRPPSRTWGGPGAGAPCALCGRTIEPHEIEMEMDCQQPIDGEKVQHFHSRCLVLVEDEVRRRNEGMSDRGRAQNNSECGS